MTSARLMNTPADFEKLGLTPGVVHPWEDGRRDDATPGHSEVWYFDATMSDGTKTVVGFRPVDPAATAAGGESGTDSPNLNVNITTATGEEFVDMIHVDVADSSIATGKCDVHFGPHFTTDVNGDLKSWHVHVEPVNGVGVDLTYEALTETFRPGGTSHIALGDNDEFYYTDQSVPRCRVTGTVTAGGNTWDVEGEGYHDHQWFNISPLAAWHHWLWGRFYAQGYTAVIYDFVTNERFGFSRVPVFGVLDPSGRVIFDNRSDAEVEVETYHDDQTDKDYPKTSNYTFRDGDATVHFTVTWSEIIEVRDMYGATSADHYGMAGKKQRAAYDVMGIKPSYMRYFADGHLTLTRDGADTPEVDVAGDMIYEFNYPGVPDERAGL